MGFLSDFQQRQRDDQPKQALTGEAVEAVLTEVIDPEIGINIVDLGMVTLVDVNATDRCVRVEFITTSPVCPMSEMIKSDIAERLARSFELRDLAVKFASEPLWTPDRMSPRAKEKMGW